MIAYNSEGNATGCSEISFTTEVGSIGKTKYGFSPNDDGLNDKFISTFCELDEFKMEVYNRWGQKIFETTDINQGWDGKAKGKKMLGIYFWVITLKSPYTNDGESYYRSGTVNLISYER